MKKLLISLIFILSSFFIADVYALDNINLYSPNYVIYDLTDKEIRLSNNLDTKVNIASLTKIMTTITAIKQCDNLYREVTITPEVFNGIPSDATVAKLKVGDKVTINDLLYASMLPSGADATQALAINLSGSVSSFVDKMNNLAKEIGMTNTHFVNVTGLDIYDHYSTVGDLYKLLEYSLQNETFKEVYTTRHHTLINGLEVNSTIGYYNKKMGLDVSRIKGSKTGFTSKAGTCISVLYESNGHDYITITTGAPKTQEVAFNVLDAIATINYIDDNYNNQILVNKNQTIKKIKVKLSKIESIDIKTKKDIKLYLPNDYDKTKVSILYDGAKSIDYKTHKGDKIGKISYYYDNQLIDEEDAIVDVDIKISYLKLAYKYRFFLIGLGIIFILILYIKSKLRLAKKRK